VASADRRFPNVEKRARYWSDREKRVAVRAGRGWICSHCLVLEVQGKGDEHKENDAMIDKCGKTVQFNLWLTGTLTLHSEHAYTDLHSSKNFYIYSTYGLQKSPTKIQGKPGLGPRPQGFRAIKPGHEPSQAGL
jgi:hypothetical protein